MLKVREADLSRGNNSVSLDIAWMTDHVRVNKLRGYLSNAT